MPLLSRRVLSFLILAVCFSTSTNLAFAAGFPDITPDELTMTSIPEEPGAPAVVLIRDEVDDNTRNYHQVFMRIKVLTEAGRKYADVHVPYNRRNFTVRSIHGRTVQPDGSVVPFEGDVLDKEVLNDRKVKIRVKTFTLPDVQVGSIIEYQYTVGYDDGRVLPPSWTLQDELLQRQVHFTFIPYDGEVKLHNGKITSGYAWTAVMPTSIKLQKTRPGSAFGGLTTTHPAYELETKNVPPFVDEQHSPPGDQLKWNIRFYFTTNVQEKEFWKDAAHSWSKEVEHFVGSPASLKDTIKNILAEADSPEQKAQKIYTYVGRLKNYSYDPPDGLPKTANNNVADVLRNSGGTSEDLNRAFLGLARAAGLQAWAMRVPDQEEAFLYPKYLNWEEQLPDEISIVELGGKEVFLDPGTRYCPFGMLDWRNANTDGYRQTAKNTEEASTPPIQFKQAMVQRLGRFTLGEDGRIQGTLKVGFFGVEAMRRRQQASRTDAAGRDKLLLDEMKTWFPSNAEVSLVRVAQWDLPELPLVAEIKVDSPMVTAAGTRGLLPLNVTHFNRPPMFTHSERKNPIYFEHAYREIDAMHITLAEGLRVEGIPEAANLRKEWALFDMTRSLNGRELLARRDLSVAITALPATEYPSVKDFFDKLKAADDEQVVLQRTTGGQ
jgi:Domain of Unknown Function with PDB structure (DUF3857)/Transglutaminase-like superfamily